MLSSQKIVNSNYLQDTHTKEKPILRQKQLNNLSNLVFTFICYNIAIDFLAGLLEIGLISQTLRIIFFAILLYIELLLDRQGFCLLISGLAFVVAQSASTQIFLQGDLSLSSFFYDIGIGIKFLMFFAVYRSILSLGKNGVFSLDKIDKAFSIAAVYVPVLYLGSLVLGIGQPSYWDGSGFKSVFSSLNSVNVSILVLFIYSMNAFFSKKQLSWLIPTVLNLLSILMLGTKSSYIFAALVFLYYLLIPQDNRLRNLIIGITIILLMYFVTSNIQFIQENIAKVYERQNYLFENRSFIDYLTSGRTWMLDMALVIFNQQNNPLAIVFGSGYYNFHHALSAVSGYLVTNNVRPIEFDWADIFFSYGLPILLLTYGFLFYMLLKKNEIKPRRFYHVALAVMIIFSCMGGHVLFEAISSITLGSVLAGIAIKLPENNFNSTMDKERVNNGGSRA